MYKKAEYFSRRFLRTAISGLIITPILIALMMRSGHINPAVYLLPIIMIAWLYMGISIRKKMKLKQNVQELWDEIIQNDQYKIIDMAFTFLIVFCLIILRKRIEYIDYTLIGLCLIYLVWIFFQFKSVMKYLNSK